MFFENFFTIWWQGLVFGIVTTIGMLVFIGALSQGWKKYESSGEPQPEHSCDAHH